MIVMVDKNCQMCMEYIRMNTNTETVEWRSLLGCLNLLAVLGLLLIQLLPKENGDVQLAICQKTLM